MTDKSTRRKNGTALTAVSSPTTNNNGAGVYTAHVCTDNSTLMAEVAQLYMPAGSKIADVTFGKGVFWRRIDRSQYDFHASDRMTVPDHPYDFRDLSCYKSGTFYIVVFDPPYRHDPGTWMSRNYQNVETTRGLDHAGIIRLYRDGMREAFRILQEGGKLLVKCQDEIQSGKQQWSHIEIYNAAIELGFHARDLFVMVQQTKPKIQRAEQKHARRNHSYLWVFQKPSVMKRRSRRP